MSRSHELRRALPEPVKPLLRRAAAALDPLVRALHRARGGPPVPPRQLRASVGQPALRRYLAEGRQVAAELRGLLAAEAQPLESFSSICDLASGPGKVLTALPLPAGAAVAAIDVNRGAVGWLRAQRPDVDARLGSPLPPTPFADGSFDLVVSISLLTHLPEASQLAWLDEVSRLLRDDGMALLTVHGEAAYDGFRSGRRPGITPAQLAALQARGSLADEGFVFEPEPNPSRRSPGVAGEWGLAFHAPDYVRRRWSDHVAVERILPGAINFRQDAVLVRPSSASR